MSVPHSAAQSPRFSELEGLRGFLAAWVIFGHILLFSGFTYTDGLFGILFSPVLGVYVFMMLSGFVITCALDAKQSSWVDFMWRRFLRIYPVYVACIALAILCVGISHEVAGHSALQEIGAENSNRLLEVEQNFSLYVFADAFLLQNLLPREHFPHAHETFLPPTWSLSLEWMFYLVMPMLIGLLRQRWQVRSLGVGAIVVLVALFQKQAEFICPSLSLANGSYFLTGIVSYYVWKHLPSFRGKRQWIAVVAFWIVLGSGMAVLSLPFKMWFAVMAMLLYTRVHTTRIWVFESFRWVLNCQPINYLGKISYSSYLLHWIVIEVCLFLGLHWIPQMEGRLALAMYCCPAVFAVTYAASHLMFKFVEQPFINLGKTRGVRKQIPAARATA